MPGALAFGHGERPVEQIAKMREDLQGGAGGFGGAEIGEGVWSVVKDFRSAIGDRGKAVAQEVTSAGGRQNHKGVKLAAYVGEEKIFYAVRQAGRCSGV